VSVARWIDGVQTAEQETKAGMGEVFGVGGAGTAPVSVLVHVVPVQAA
jgi:hypothetical protein